MKHWQATLATFTALLSAVALAEDFKTIEGKEYKNVTISRVEPDGLVLTTKTGISKVYFVELPKEVQERFLPSTPKTRAAQDAMIKLKSWAAAVKNPTSFVLLSIGVGSLIVAGVFAIARSIRHRPKQIVRPAVATRRRL